MAVSKKTILNISFLVICGAILAFLLNAPKETTPHLPHDADHTRFYEIKSKKEAEKFCLDCHDQTAQAPLPENHPPKFRCLLCHKRVD